MKQLLKIPSHLIATLPGQETTDDMKQMSCLTINFNLI